MTTRIWLPSRSCELLLPDIVTAAAFSVWEARNWSSLDFHLSKGELWQLYVWQCLATLGPRWHKSAVTFDRFAREIASPLSQGWSIPNVHRTSLWQLCRGDCLNLWSYDEKTSKSPVPAFDSFAGEIVLTSEVMTRRRQKALYQPLTALQGGGRWPSPLKLGREDLKKHYQSLTALQGRLHCCLKARTKEDNVLPCHCDSSAVWILPFSSQAGTKVTLQGKFPLGSEARAKGH